MKKILAIKNINIENLGNMETIFKNRKYTIDVYNAYESKLTPEIQSYDIVIILGGPMGVYESDRYPFLKKEMGIIEKCMKYNKKLVGICLGAQLIAHVLGAKTYRGEKGKEIGWCKVKLYEDFKDVFGDDMTVFQWHGDTFELPEGVKRLASSEKYQNQAFVYGNSTYALQFHIEVRKTDIINWIAAYRNELVEENIPEEHLLGNENWSKLEGISKKFILHFLMNA